MRLTRLLFLLITVLVVLSSCDENKSKAKEIAKQFADAVNNKDKATIQELFPDSKDMPNMSIVESINSSGITIEYEDSLKEYTAYYGDEKRQSIVLKLDSSNNMRIIDTQHIYNLDSVVYELAFKTGVPLNKLSDIHLCDLMKDGSPYINGLSYAADLGDNLKLESYSFDWDRYATSPTLYAIIRNKSKTIVKGEDYKIEFFLYYQYTNNNYLTLVVDGKDISAGGRERIQALCDGIDDVGDINSNTYVKCRFAYSNLSVYEQLLKYGDWNGKEYNIYLEVNQTMDENDAKLDKLIKITSTQKLSEDDIKDLLSTNLRLLRNSIYAKHGYLFKDKELTKYFSSFDWYKGTTTNMSKVSAEFNDVEKYNVKFIKEHE